MKCSNCGMDLEEGAVFCPYCGTRQEENASVEAQAEEAAAEVTSVEAPTEEAAEETTSVEAPTEEAATETTSEETPAEEAQAAEPAYAGTPVEEAAYGQQTESSFVAPDPVVWEEAAPEAPKKKKTGAVLIGIIIALLVVLIVVLLVLFGGKIFSGKGKQTVSEAKYLRYVKDDVIYLMDKDKKKPMELGDVPHDTDNEEIYRNSEYWGSATYNYNYSYTEDGKGLYFLLDDDLYYKDLKKTEAEAERVDKDVQDYDIVDADTLVYIKGDDHRLYVSRKGEAEKVDKEIGWSLKISDDKKGVFYNKINDDDTYDCYYLNLKDLSTERILKNVDDYDSSDLNNIIFMKDDKLGVLKNFSDEEKITSDCANYSTYYDTDDSLKILYVVSNGEGSIPLYDFVEDDLAVSDAKVEEPNIDDYTTIEQVEDWWGDVYDREVTDYDAYYAAQDAYYDKENRDYYRDSLKEDTIDISEGTLYSYDVKTGESTEIMQAYFQGYVNYQLVSYMDPEDLPTYKFSELLENDEVWDLYSKVSDALNQYCKYVLISGNQTVELDIDPEEYIDAYLYNYGDSQNAILELTQPENEDDYNYLYTVATISLSGKNMGEYTVIDTDAVNIYYNYLDDKGKNLYYFKDLDNGVGDLYRDGEKVAKNASALLDEVNGKLLYAGETDSEHNEFELYLDGERIARNVGYLWGDYYYYLTEKGDIYYASDLDVEDGVCNFKVNYYNGKESTTVIEDAASFLAIDDSHMFYLTDYSSRRYKGTLMFYNGRKATQVDEDVAAIAAYY